MCISNFDFFHAVHMVQTFGTKIAHITHIYQAKVARLSLEIPNHVHKCVLEIIEA